MGRVSALCTGERKGEPKRPVKRALFRARHGLVGDAHAGGGARQVSLLAAEDVRRFARRLRGRHKPRIGPGSFAENVLVSGLDLGGLGLGSRIRLGRSVVLRVTRIGKTCPAPCAIGRAVGSCLMPKAGLFAEVVRGGRVGSGDAAEAIEVVPRSRLQVAVLTVSDRGSRGEARDTAGPAVAARAIEALGARVCAREILPDEREKIAARLAYFADELGADLVLTVGGTGFSPRDVTPEATREVVERLAPGLDEAMRAASRAVTPHAMLSRGVSGLRRATLIVNLPGSERAARENLEALLPALPHGLAKLRGDPSECGRPAGGRRR